VLVYIFTDMFRCKLVGLMQNQSRHKDVSKVQTFLIIFHKEEFTLSTQRCVDFDSG